MEGFINLDKPSGISSHQAVAAIRRLLHCKAGHTGTLDPQATGVLPLCLGKATRLAEYVSGQPKLYDSVIRFGIQTDSYDADGCVTVERDASHLKQTDVQKLLPRFCGNIMQIPPLISAIKQDGQPLYKRARRGETLKPAPRPVYLSSVELIEGEFGEPTPWVKLRIACGKGFYVRSLAHDLGELLGVGAHVAALRRLAVGQFIAEDAYTLAQIEAMNAREDYSFIKPLSYGISHLPCFVVESKALAYLAHGNDWQLAGQVVLPLCRVQTAAGELVGLGHIKPADPGGSVLSMDKVLIEAQYTKLRNDSTKLKSAGSGYSVMAIGNFDGLHVGHQELLRHLQKQKERLGGHSAVLTFNPHPLQLIKGETPPLLNTLTEKRQLIMGKHAADALIELDFDEKFRSSSPQAFIDEVIAKQAAARLVVVGFNFRFGKDGMGDAQILKDLCKERGIEVEIVQAVSGSYGLVSSSNIRRHLQVGDMAAVNQMLGYSYSLAGQVVRGNQLGRKLGFPTANFHPPAKKALPPCGVYAGHVDWQGGTYKAVINLGVKPTISPSISKPLVEAHLFAELPELYGERITVYFQRFIRREQCFSGLEELTKQIKADCQVAQNILS
ncbi:MAG: bifunctional riboflavin kinase/FAD synthetase [Clostridiales bacterium]|nr:bifunctional riboflavin kinase/FAD synthetase [Clostridiales bacterium]